MADQRSQTTPARPPAPTTATVWSRCREISASCRAPCGSTTTASSSPPRTCTRASSRCATSTAGRTAAREDLADGINLQLPSGSRLKFGNTDFDVNLAITNPAFDQRGQLFFDIFDTDGFLGDILAVNGAYYPFMKVLPRRYRFRILNASMSRFIKLALAVNASSRFSRGTKLPFHFIANDGNFVVNPIKLTELDEQGVAERYDIVVDFSQFRNGDSIYLVNLLQQTDGRKPDGAVSVVERACRNDQGPCRRTDPGVPRRRRAAKRRRSDLPLRDRRERRSRMTAPTSTTRTGRRGRKTLTTQIPDRGAGARAHHRVRAERAGRLARNSGWPVHPGMRRHRVLPVVDQSQRPDGALAQRQPHLVDGPEAGRGRALDAHQLERRLGPPDPPPFRGRRHHRAGGQHSPGQPNGWCERMSGGSGQTDRSSSRSASASSAAPMSPTATTRRTKISPCSCALQLLTPKPGEPDYKGQPQWAITPTPIPSPTGVTWKTPEVLPEGDPDNPEFQKRSGSAKRLT